MTHFFSSVRVVARPSQDQWLRDLAWHGEAYRDHALIWRLFPGDGLDRDFLFRRINDPSGGLRYYVVSQRPPQPNSGLFHIQTKAYQPQLAVGDWVFFDLRANPTISQRDDAKEVKPTGKKPRGVRHDVLAHTKRLFKQHPDWTPEALKRALDEAGSQWLLSRMEHWGLRVDKESLMQEGYQQQCLSPRNKGRSIEFSSLDYQGQAQVVNAEALHQALLKGVGHSKGFGCGLLLVRRL